jgi:hypothetical protein
MNKPVLAALVLLAILGLAARTQAPEIQRYLKVRKM